MADREDITRLIQDWRRGDKDAEDRLFSALYTKLHAIAAGCLLNEPAARSLSPTALLHEAYVRFNRSEAITVYDRNHFMALSALVMRRILVDRARKRRTQRRSAEVGWVENAEALMCTDAEADHIIAVDRALEQLAQQAPRQAKLVALRFFAGYTLEECAAIMAISTRTARREWDVARTRLRIAIEGDPASTVQD
jgi:RNA polymerase sigma-70 factor, ECF subfamily